MALALRGVFEHCFLRPSVGLAVRRGQNYQTGYLARNLTSASGPSSRLRHGRQWSDIAKQMLSGKPQEHKPLHLQIQDPGPNPQKVGIILEELGLPYNVSIIGNEPQSDESTSVSSGKAPPVQDKNTGMIILNDPNHDVTLWESLAIVEYLVQKYDKDGNLHYPSDSQAWWMCQQWLAYQMGAQSPFFSLKAWFSNQHQKKVPSVIDRFSDDVLRIVSILEHYLKEGKGDYLVGDKCTYADLVFVPWNNKIEEVMGRAEAWQIERCCPRYREWHYRLMERSAVQRVMANKSLSIQ